MGDILGDETPFETIHLRGSALSLTGAGIMKGPFFNYPKANLSNVSNSTRESSGNGPLELVFVVDAPHYLLNIPVISSFYRAIRPVLVQLRVSGSFDEPIVESVAFPSLGDALRQLETRKKSDKKQPPHPLPKTR